MKTNKAPKLTTRQIESYKKRIAIIDANGDKAAPFAKLMKIVYEERLAAGRMI